MSIARLYVKQFRNLLEQTVDLHDELNVIVGDNGSGKSSLLEALFFTGHGKSFRTSKSDNLIGIDSNKFIVSTKTVEGKVISVSKSREDATCKIRIDSENRYKLSELAQTTAIQIITPESFKLFFGGAKERRKFLDLGLFHVEHKFQQSWKSFTKVLKHRNALLRNGTNLDTLPYWNQEFCKASEELSSLREHYATNLATELSIWLSILLPDLKDQIELQYFRGWNQKKVLADVLNDAYQREIKQGFSYAGAQKFDFRFLVEKQPLDIKLSRGQQKLFLLAITFAQSALMKKVLPIKPILLIDDVGAELDLTSREKLANVISKLAGQVIITAIDKNALAPMIKNDNNYKMFHVKHGEISIIGNRL